MKRLIASAFIVMMAVAIIGCDPPPTCDANLTHLTAVGNTTTNVFKQAIPANPAIDPNSSAIITKQCNLMAADKGFNEQVLCDISGWAAAVYYTDAAQTRNQYVRLHLDGNPSYGGITSMGPIRWRSCITGGSASDGPALMVDKVDGCQYEFWMLNKNALIADPECGWGGGLAFDDADQVWNDYEGLGCTASGASQYCSSIWPDECTTGFDHGFFFGAPWEGNEAGKSVYPFNHADGSGTDPVLDLQGGRQVQLNPSFDISTLPLYKQTVCQAMKTYGMYQGNSGGLNWGVYGVCNRGYTNNPWNGVLPDPTIEYWEVGAPVVQFRVLAKTAYTTCNQMLSNNSCTMYYGGNARGVPPTITSITPSTAAAGTTVSLVGTNLSNPIAYGADSNPGAIRFNNTPATNVTAVSSTLVTCTVPAGTGAVKVSYRTTEGASNMKDFTYSAGGPAPTLSSLNPNNGAAAGGTAVTLTGTNFISGATVSFGGSAATGVVVASSTQIRCTSPAGSGTVSVTVTTPNGTSGGVNFTYNVAPPTLSAIAPTSGSTAGGTACTLAGTNLTGCSAVSFGGTAASGIVVDSATQVRCTSPAKTAGTISVTATTPGGTSNGVSYTYVQGGTVTTLYSPADSYVSSSSSTKNFGTTNLVIQKNASIEAAAYIKFDLNSVAGTTITDAKLKLNFWTTGTAVTKVYSCATDSWGETTIKWSNKPAWGTEQASFTSPNNNWVEVNVTSYIAANFNGDKLVTMVIRQDTNLNVNLQAYSDETGASTGKRPMLIVTSS